MKKTLLALSLSALTLTAYQPAAMADAHKAGSDKSEAHGEMFMKSLAHASFMPNIMKYLQDNKTALEINDEQMKALNEFHKKNSPDVKNMVKDLIWTEKKARSMALENYPPMQVLNVGALSLKIRYEIMKQKVACRSFVKSVLTPEQYKKALTGYEG